MKKKFVTILMIVCVLSATVIEIHATPIWLDGVTSASGWHDANKTGTDDTLLCWAAGASNMLSYTQWWGGPSLVTEGQIFNQYKSFWNDDFGSPYYGVDWWFTGQNDHQGDTGWAQLTDTSHTGYFAQTLFNTNYVWKNYGAIDDIYSYIDDKRGTSLRITKGDLGHVLTVWGIDKDIRKIWVTDSDLFNGNTDKTLEDYVIDANGTFSYRGNTWSISEVHGLLRNTNHIPPVPEPSSSVLVVLGLVFFLFLKRKNLI